MHQVYLGVTKVLLGVAVAKTPKIDRKDLDTLHDLEYISVTSDFTRLNMKTKYVCRGHFSLYVNFHNNRTMGSTNLQVKICRWGGRKKSRFTLPAFKMLLLPARTENSSIQSKFFVLCYISLNFAPAIPEDIDTKNLPLLDYNVINTKDEVLLKKNGTMYFVFLNKNYIRTGRNN